VIAEIAELAVAETHLEARLEARLEAPLEAPLETRNFSVIEPVSLGFPWLTVFTTLALHRGEPVSFKAGECEEQRRELERALAPLHVTWLALEHGVRVVGVPPHNPALSSVSSHNPTLPPVSAAAVPPASAAIPPSAAAMPPASAAIPPSAAAIPPSINADGALLTQKGTAVAFTTADCLPVVCVSEQHKVAAALHAGWKSLAGGIIEGALERLQKDHGIAPSSLKVWIGPAITQGDYEVSTEVRSALLERPAIAEKVSELFVASRTGHWLADLPGSARAILTSQGVEPQNIEWYFGSTKRNPLLHSARRDKEASGRMATVVGLNGVDVDVVGLSDAGLNGADVDALG
jgi:YfiH family protein